MKILFVCSGNTCRSPMAEGYLSSKNMSGISVLSAGFISEGDEVSENAVRVMKEIGIDISAHKSRLISPDMLSADKIFCMSLSHRKSLISAGVSEDKISVLSGGVSDPFGGDINTYRACRDEIINAIDNILYGGTLIPFKILPAGKEDIKDIAELEKECFSSPWSENAILETMHHKGVFFKAVQKNKTIGYISVTAISGEGYINNIAVSKASRGQGAGALLLDRAITFARCENLEFLSLEVRTSNKGAISLYEKAYFKREGIRKNFYENPKEDGIIMTRRFTYENIGD